MTQIGLLVIILHLPTAFYYTSLKLSIETIFLMFDTTIVTSMAIVSHPPIVTMFAIEVK